MKRFITYLYEYKELKKSNNVGFIKVESQSEITRMMVVIKSRTISGQSGKVYLIFEDTVGILLGEIKMGEGEIRQVYEFDTERIKDSDYCIDDVKGIRIEMPDNFMASCWTDDMDVVTQHNIMPYKPVQAAQKIVDHDDSAVLQMKQELPVEKTKNETAGQEQNVCEKENSKETVMPDTKKKTVRRIDISELRTLPSKNWYLVNNSFLMHGYANYKHLVIKTDSDGREYLGVPGVSEAPERMMAKIFGFNEFEPAAPATAADVESGIFGYWFCPIDLR